MRLNGVFFKGLAVIAVVVTMAGAQIQISDFSDLQKIGRDPAYPLNGRYELAADIANQGLPLTPIGTKDAPFTGTFDGKSKRISNFSINGTGHVGIFGYVGKNATIRNLNVTVGNSITGGYNVGAIAGTNHGTIADCNVSASGNGSITAAREQGNVGGLVGSNSGTIERSSSNVAVRGTENIGGLVGLLDGGTIKQSYAQGSAGNENSKNVGGLVGYVFGGTIYHSYATGNVNGNEHTGGLIGYDFGSARAGWNTAGRSASGSVQKATVAACFWDRTRTNQISSAGVMGEGRNTVDMQRIGTFTSAGWDFGGEIGSWEIGTGGGYPTIKGAPAGTDENDLREFSLFYSVRDNNGMLDIEEHGVLAEFEIKLLNGRNGPNVTAVPNDGYRFAQWSDGVTARTRRDAATRDVNAVAEFEINDDPDIPGTAIRIYTYEDLKKIGNDPAFPLNVYYVQMRDIDASESRTENDGEGFMPIGRSHTNPFTGTFDGRGYAIQGLYINRPNTDNVGLFGVVGGLQSGKRIVGVNVVEGTIIGRQNVGGLVGYAKDYVTVITNSSVRGIIRAEGYVGGFAGWCVACTIEDSYSAGSVFGGVSHIGGLVGFNWSYGVIIRSYSTADVNGESNIGGLVGANGAYSEIIQCFSTGSVHGTNDNNVGGLVGQHDDGRSITESYSYGRVANGNAGHSIGGLVGNGSVDALVSNSFWDITTSGQPPRNPDWGIGLSSSDLKQRDTYGPSWDFVDVWAIAPNINDGYPYLRTLGPPVYYTVNQPSPPEANSPAPSVSRTTGTPGTPSITLRGRTLSVVSPSVNSNLQIRVVDLRGRTVARFNTATTSANSRFSLSKLSAGRYLVEVRDVNRNRVNVSSIMVR